MKSFPVILYTFSFLVQLCHLTGKNTGVPVSKTVMLVGGMADGGAVCNEGLSPEH